MSEEGPSWPSVLSVGGIWGEGEGEGGRREGDLKEKKTKTSISLRRRSKWRKFTSGTVLKLQRRDEQFDLAIIICAGLWRERNNKRRRNTLNC